MKKIFLFGWFGQKNLGDDALLNQTLSLINNINPDSKITVFTNNTEMLLSGKFNVNYESKSKKSLFKAIKEYDVYIFGPGGLFPNKDTKKILFIYLYILLLKMKHKKIIFLGLGIENCNFSGKLNRLIINLAMRKVDDCTLRYDFNMYDEQKNLKDKCTVSSDIMFLKDYKKSANNSKTKYIVVALANIFREDEYKENFIKSLRPALLKMIDDGFELHFLTFTDNLDYQLNSLVINSLGEKNKYCKNISFTENIDEIIDEISLSTLVVGMRYHSLVFASNLLIPFIPLSYSSKIEELLYDIDLEILSTKICINEDKYFCKIIELNQDEVLDKYQYVMQNYKDVKEKLAVALPKQKEKAEKHIKTLEKYIKES